MDVKLRIRVAQRDLGEEYVSETCTSAKLAFKNGKYYLSYLEADPEGGELRCLIKAGPDRLDIIRRGAQESHMVLDAGKRTAEMRDTPAGPLKIETETTGYRIESGEGFLCIETEYDLFLEGEFISACSAEIEAVCENRDECRSLESSGGGEGK